MDWKNVAVGAITTLIVGTLTGLAVWFFTREPEKSEGLQYSISRPGIFGNGPERLVSYSIDVRNTGSVKAQSVTINITQEADAKLTESQTQFERPVPEGISIANKSKTYLVKVPKFLPTDRATISLLYRGNAKTPQVLIRSADGIGRPKPTDDGETSFRSKRWQLFLALGSFAVSAIISSIISRKIVNIASIRFLISNKNDSAFMLFHAGLVDLAHDILIEALRSGQSGPIVLSNLAAVKSFQGTFTEALGLIEASYRWASTNHSKSIVYFNDFLRLHRAGAHDKSYELLRKSASYSKTPLTYCRRSVIVRGMVDRDPALKSLIDDLTKPKKG